ncbi:hypothetical protein HC251_11345 [Iamia sp. SCSIO 61187]|uniref:hypothetical protein n=1 Tax=Iamia sp. SCSIO 61187 TaxID=2722752 RepID=UPI001C62CB2E|nr:hypothetical protein [Iamia sp. SCSIO 61187]QYG92966.1 hypothetical protein HC251_11345 [Iamia sp. SCSIO 61187]
MAVAGVVACGSGGDDVDPVTAYCDGIDEYIARYDELDEEERIRLGTEFSNAGEQIEGRPARAEACKARYDEFREQNRPPLEGQ